MTGRKGRHLGHFSCTPCLLQPPVVQPNNPVHLCRQPLVMSGDQRRRIMLAHQAQKLRQRSEEHTSELQSLMRISYAVFCLKNKKTKTTTSEPQHTHLIMFTTST